MGHQKGAETVRMVIRTSAEMGVAYLTLYAFSRENWKRPKIEIDFLMGLLDRFLDSEREELKREGVRFHTIGKTGDLPQNVQSKLERMKEETRENRRLNLIVALNYGSRQEIVEAALRLREESLEAERKGQAPPEISERTFSEHLDTADFPDPDLLIRTSGELRISNFLLWQLSYSEIHSSGKYWPDFGREDYLAALRDYAVRNRRYGAVS